VQPLLLPVWLEINGIVLLTFGLSHAPKAPVEKPQRKARKQKRARQPALHGAGSQSGASFLAHRSIRAVRR
jgi:hypothetical protein